MLHSASIPTPSEASGSEQLEVFQRIGSLTRNLHEALKALGYDKNIESSLVALPDARTRLDFIARVTGNAAEKVLNTVDAAQSQQNLLLAAAERAEQALRGSMSSEALQVEMQAFVEKVRDSAHVAGGHLSDIMLAQDFHDLTGQTIRKVVELATLLEDSLLQLLLDATPREYRDHIEATGLQGPVANAEGRADVVSGQEQVDDLLASLGF